LGINVTVPERFELINRSWKVVWLTDTKEQELLKKVHEAEPDEPPPSGLYGYCDVEHATIYLKRSKDRDHLMHTFLHEWGHAYAAATGLRVPDEEAFVESLSGCMHQWLKSKEGTLK